MSLNIVNNRSSFATFRATLNTWVASLNTANTNITTNTSNIGTLQSDMTAAQGDITTLQGDMTTAQSDITGKQDKNAISTLLLKYKTDTSGAYTLDTDDNNALVHITNIGASDFNFPLGATVPNFLTGGQVKIYNDSTSSNNITLKATGGATISTSSTYTTTVVPGASAVVVKIGTNAWLRIQ